MLLSEFKGRVQLNVIDEKVPQIINIVSKHFFNWESFDEDKIRKHLKRELLNYHYHPVHNVFLDDMNKHVSIQRIAFELQRWIESNSDNL